MGRPMVVVEVHGSMTPRELARACTRVEGLLREGLPVRAQATHADVVVLGALARMRLWAARLDALLEVSVDGGELVELCGLGDALQMSGEAEAGEQRGVEEVVDVGDPSP